MGLTSTISEADYRLQPGAADRLMCPRDKRFSLDAQDPSTGRRPWRSRSARLGALTPFLLPWLACAGAPPSPAASDRSAVEERSEPVQAPTVRPSLVIWITVDQMRADSFERYGYLLGAAGFRRLLQTGFSFSAAAYAHAITETAPGHATLFTGASPRTHGIVANSWLLPDGKKTESVSDPGAALVGPALLPAEATADAGRSPRFLLVPTVGDLLRRSTEGRSLVFGLSSKDRGAILPAGQSGEAYWLGEAGFVTSRYYQSAVPRWLSEHHRTHPPERYLAQGWQELLASASYRRPASRHPLRTSKLTAGFPHRAARGTTSAAVLKLTPFGDEAVLDLARTVIEHFHLGEDDAADLLSLSLSSTDYVGHYFGPESREAEDNFARLDRNLGRFFDFVEQHTEAGRVLFVLSADHGISESPEHLRELGLAGARMTQAELVARAEEALEEHLGDPNLLLGVAPPSVYLNREALAQRGVDPIAAARVVQAALRQAPALREAYVTLDPASLPEWDDLATRVALSLYPGRSGDLYVLCAPYGQIDVDGDLVATHGSPYGYDRNVPLLLAGPGIPRGTSSVAVDPRSVASTVARLLGLAEPAAAELGPLPHVPGAQP